MQSLESEHKCALSLNEYSQGGFFGGGGVGKARANWVSLCRGVYITTILYLNIVWHIRSVFMSFPVKVGVVSLVSKLS